MERCVWLTEGVKKGERMMDGGRRSGSQVCSCAAGEDEARQEAAPWGFIRYSWVEFTPKWRLWQFYMTRAAGFHACFWVLTLCLLTLTLSLLHIFFSECWIYLFCGKISSLSSLSSLVYLKQKQNSPPDFKVLTCRSSLAFMLTCVTSFEKSNNKRKTKQESKTIK